MARRFAWVFALVVWGCGDDDSSMTPDGGDDATSICMSDDMCVDGLYCNGEESCDPDNAAAGTDGCVAGDPPCPAMGCDEIADVCDEGCPDADADGAADAACGGTDCDDDDPNRYPGNTEVCDPDNRDEDCDPRTFGFRDGDMDGEGDAACCNMDGGTLNCGDDCDDARSTVNTTAPEVCDTLDNDCDSDVDEGVLVTYYEDMDGDMFGDADGATMLACARPDGFSDTPGDCDDMVPGVNPGVTERCEMTADVDDNCDGTINEDCACTEGETRPCSLPGACAAGVETCDSGTWSTTCSILPEVEICDGIDNDCMGDIDEGLTVVCYRDDDNDTYPSPVAAAENLCPASGRPEVGQCPIGFTNRVPGGTEDDCDETRSSVNPGASEICIDGAVIDLDDDCDGSIDEGVSATCWVDADNDTFGPGGASMKRCTVSGRDAVGGCPFTFTNREPGTVGDSETDCDDSQFNINPDAMEVCDASMVDEDCDGAGNPPSICDCSGGETRACSEGGFLGVCAGGIQTCTAGTWGSCSIPPAGTETACDGLDEDCDGATDETLLTTCYTDSDRDDYAPAGATATQVCACPMGTTDREPVGMDVDCDDGDINVNPGESEICDRIDNDCSSGGGVDVAEDVDNDGYARSTAACLGGFPKTDCNDADRNVFPGQTRYFTEPRCDGHNATYPCGGTPRCFRSCIVIAPVPDSYDYDCDAVATPQPAFTACAYENPPFVCGVGFGECVGDNPQINHPAAQCGNSVPFFNCLCDTSGPSNICSPFSGNEELGCR